MRKIYILAIVTCAWCAASSAFAQRFLDQLENVLDAESAAEEAPAALPARAPGYVGFIAIERLDRIEIELVRAESAAERAGIQVGDVITHVDGREVKTLDQLGEALAGRLAGERVAFSVARGEIGMRLPATLDKRPPVAAAVDEVPPEPDPFAPDIVRNTPQPKAELPIDALGALKTLEEVLEAEAPEAAVPDVRSKVDAEREKRIATFESELEAIKRRIRELEREVSEMSAEKR